ncbi:MAG: 4-(cytidine 5'-diphospho)-2-C-methyl-D-erythritol kinase [Hymenobacteraceae bacterium]|nr:4-(cytidine 5'-diphospho)-2-C-methyl-D-erythritol kinase [Hymenobacteraceae bacterium]MDX5394936.1 4-(cytidine 5'-diphospho)-2-C-methyl-D-erythritol kinase [Hymenobacteraceae bacterium]MDX5510970.1 4-(cytidine 5'-diphospho)-2-C-methyl-D-erythritol kinase [Hymenobacteraceae bacterium]
MIVFPNAKINIGLNVVAKRADGFHELASCFYPVQWTDGLEILPSEKTVMDITGIPVPGEVETNLCLKAYELLKKDFELPPGQMHLHKVIPRGAGLGGGSADAAFALKALNQLFELNLSEEQLEAYARQLGSDCAFFIQNKPVFAKERGDVFESLELNLKGYAVVLVYPNLHITTAEAYRHVKPKAPEQDLRHLLQQPINTWKHSVKNDFEEALFPDHPVLPELKEQLYQQGAIYAAMSGSGSTIFGIFEKNVPETLSFPEEYLIWKGRL